MANPFITQGVDMQNPEAVQIMRRQKMAEQLLSQGQEPLNGQMVSGHYVAPSWTQQLAKGLNTYMGQKGLKESDEAQKALAETLRGKRQEDLGKFAELLSGTPAGNAPVDGVGPVQPAQAPDLNAAYKYAMGSQTPELQQFGMQGMLTQAQAQMQQQQAEQTRKKAAVMWQAAGGDPQKALAMGMPADMVKQFAEAPNFGKEKGVINNGVLQNPITGETIGKVIPKQVDASTAKLIQDANGKWVPNPAMVAFEQQTAPLKAPKLQVSLNEGQKGFENESKLRSDFKSEPIYKDYADMKSAYGQIKASLKMESPIGDVGGATKMMKLFDPGSVVRESELGIAMAAAGKIDRLKNFVDMWASGKKLTPTQRKDFSALADELFDVAGKVYNETRGNYEQQGQRYNLNTSVLGAPHGKPKTNSILDEADSILRGGK